MKKINKHYRYYQNIDRIIIFIYQFFKKFNNYKYIY